jgi:hypothetical protein
MFPVRAADRALLPILRVIPAGPAVDETGSRRARSTCPRFTRAEVQGVGVVAVRACGCGPFQEPCLQGAPISGRPRSPARSSPRAGRSEAEQARAARAVQERRRAGEGLWAPGSGTPLERRLTGRCACLWLSPSKPRVVPGRSMLILCEEPMSHERQRHGNCANSSPAASQTGGQNRAKHFSPRSPQRRVSTRSDGIPIGHGRRLCPHRDSVEA